MTFGEAITELKKGKRIQREGWYGKGQYAELATKISFTNSKGEVINKEHAEVANNAIAFVGSSGVQIGWVATQSDMLAEDWQIVE